MQGMVFGDKEVLYKGTWGDVKMMVPFLGTLNIRCRIIIGIQEGTIILTTTHIWYRGYVGILEKKMDATFVRTDKQHKSPCSLRFCTPCKALANPLLAPTH